MKEFVDLSPAELDQFAKLYSTSFLPVETKPIEKVLFMLRNDGDYRLIAAENDGGTVGFSLLYNFRDFQFGLLDYLAVLPSCRNNGIGTKLFRHSVEVIRTEIPKGIGLFLEVQKENVADPAERNLRQRRLGFYKKIGARMITPYYLLPPQVGSEPEETYLLVVPFGNLEFFEKESLIQFIKLIHLKVYHYQKDDLAEQIGAKLDKITELTDIQA